MVNLVHQLTALIESGQFLVSVEDAQIDLLLDARDGASFESNWVRVSKAAPHADSSVVDSLREAAFKRAFDVTQHAELAGYVSDDFGLLAQFVFAGDSDPWLVALFQGYVAGQLPHGELVLSSYNLVQSVSAFTPQ